MSTPGTWINEHTPGFDDRAAPEKQKALEALAQLQRTPPDATGRPEAQQAAAQALRQFADKLADPKAADGQATTGQADSPPPSAQELAKQQRDLARQTDAAGRLADEENPFGVDVVLIRVRVDKADGALKVLVTGRRRAAILQAIVDRHGEEAEARPLFDLDRRGISLVAADPTAAMHRDDRRQWLLR